MTDPYPEGVVQWHAHRFPVWVGRDLLPNLSDVPLVPVDAQTAHAHALARPETPHDHPIEGLAEVQRWDEIERQV